MVVINQFRLREIPCNYYKKSELFDIIKKNAKVITTYHNGILIKYRYGLNIAAKWFIYIEKIESNYEIVMENEEDPVTTIGYLGVFGGREFLKKIENKIF